MINIICGITEVATVLLGVCSVSTSCKRDDITRVRGKWQTTCEASRHKSKSLEFINQFIEVPLQGLRFQSVVTLVSTKIFFLPKLCVKNKQVSEDLMF